MSCQWPRNVSETNFGKFMIIPYIQQCLPPPKFLFTILQLHTKIVVSLLLLSLYLALSAEVSQQPANSIMVL